MLRIAGRLDQLGWIFLCTLMGGQWLNKIRIFFSLATPNPSSCVNITALKWIKMKIKCQHVIPLFHLNSHFSDIFRSELMSFIRNQKTFPIHTLRVSNRQNLIDSKCYVFFHKKIFSFIYCNFDLLDFWRSLLTLFPVVFLHNWGCWNFLTFPAYPKPSR